MIANTFNIGEDKVFSSELLKTQETLYLDKVTDL